MLVYGIHSQLVVTTALILTFSPVEKGQRLHASLDAVVRRANPVAGAFRLRGHGSPGRSPYQRLPNIHISSHPRIHSSNHPEHEDDDEAEDEED